MQAIWTTETQYKVVGNWRVEIILTEDIEFDREAFWENEIEGMQEAWIWKDGYGMKNMMFGGKWKKDTFKSMVENEFVQYAKIYEEDLWRLEKSYNEDGEEDEAERFS